MTRLLLLGVLLLAIGGPQAGVVPAGPRPAGGAPASGTAIITGRILSESDVPITAAIVSISRGGAPRADSTRMLTDAQGRPFVLGRGRSDS